MSTTWKKKFELRVSDDFKLNTVSFSVILLMIRNETDFWFYIVIINACADPMVRSHIEPWHHRSVLRRHNSRFWCRTAFVQRRSQNQQKLKVPGCPFKKSSGVKLWRRRAGTDTGLLHCIDPVMYWSDCNWSLSRRRRRCFPLTLKAE